MLLSNAISAQNLRYSIRLGNEKMGEMKASKTGSTKSKYHLESRIKVEKMISIDFFYQIDASFEKNILQVSNAIETANGKEHTKSETKKNGNTYTVSTTKEKKILANKGITYNLCKLYFEEPKEISSVWSDTFGEMLTIKKAGDQRYELVLPNGKSSFYTYYKGICTLVETEITFGKISFTLTK